MKGNEVLTLGAVGVIKLYTQVHVHTTKLFWPAMYMSSWAGYFSRLAMVDPRSPCAHKDADDVHTIPYACAVLLIGGLVHFYRFTELWSLTSLTESRSQACYTDR